MTPADWAEIGITFMWVFCVIVAYFTGYNIAVLDERIFQKRLQQEVAAQLAAADKERG